MNSTTTTPDAASPSFCSHCGKDYDHHHSHGLSFWEEVVELGFHFDFRHLRSLPLLLVPGRLARLHHGPERGRYSPPLKIYVFICILFFGFFFANSSVDDFTRGVTDGSKLGKMKKSEVIANLNMDGGEDADDKDLADMIGIATKEGGSINLGAFGDKLGINRENVHLDHEHLGPNLRKATFIGLFLVFPLLSLLLKLIYRRQEIGFWEHMAFVLYAQTSIFLLLLCSQLAEHIPWRRMHWSPTNLVLASGAFLYFSQKNYYAQSWRKTLVKFGILVNAYFFSLMFMIIFSFCIGLLLSLE